MPSVRVQIDSERIATISLDAPGKRVNTLSRAMWADLSAAIEEFQHKKPTGVIIASAKPSSFVVGADLYELCLMNDAELNDYIRTGQQILQWIEDLPMPTVAAINGHCLGGGLELAMACKVRVAVSQRKMSDRKIAIGLPETTLGLVPGWAGTVRLPAIVGLKLALELICCGVPVDPEHALRIGLIDETCEESELLATAHARLALTVPARQPPVMVGNEHQTLLSHLESVVREKFPKDQIPASLAVLRIMHGSQAHGHQAELELARKTLVELRRSRGTERLLQAFFDRQAAKES